MASADVSTTLGQLVALAIKAEVGPLTERCATLTAQVATMAPELAALRERVAVAEARPPIPGPPGPAGADGLSLDELTATQDPDDPRIITLAYRRGEQIKTLGTLRLTTPLYCGVYDSARTYSPGDQVTHAGSLWHCHAVTAARPGNGGEGWTLQVKKGEGR